MSGVDCNSCDFVYPNLPLEIIIKTTKILILAAKTVVKVWSGVNAPQALNCILSLVPSHHNQPSTLIRKGKEKGEKTNKTNKRR